MAESKEDKRRWDLALEAIDEALESDDLTDRLQAAVAWAFTDIADSLNVISQYVEAKGAAEAKVAGRRGKPTKPSDEEDE